MFRSLAHLSRCRAAMLALAASLLAATSVAAPKAWVGNFKDDTVSVIDTGSNTVVATVPVAKGPHGMAVAASGSPVYVSSDGASVVNVIDAATDKVTSTIEVGRSPHGVALTPDGRFLLVGVYGEDKVVFVDTATRAIVGFAGVAKPHTIAMRPDGKLAYVASQQPGAFALAVIDIPSRSVARTIPLDKPPRDLEFGWDGKALYFTQAGVDAVQVLDAANDNIVASIATGASPHIAMQARGAAFGTVVVQGPGELTLFDPATRKVVRSIAVGKQPHWMAPADGGKTFYVSNEGSNDVTVVDVAKGTTKTIPVGLAPRKIVVQPAGGASGTRVSIANFAFSPAQLVVPAKTSVTWSNDDGAPHGIAFADGKAPASLLLPGATHARTFDTPGTYDYICSVHPYMTGRVVVR